MRNEFKLRILHIHYRVNYFIHTWLQPGVVKCEVQRGNRLNGFLFVATAVTWLKPGVNKKSDLPSAILYSFRKVIMIVKSACPFCTRP